MLKRGITLANKRILVWDIPVRLFHWLLVCCLIGSWYTSDGDKGLIDIHILFGYSIFALVIFRVIWGFVGTKHAQFSQFLPSKTTITHYFSGKGESIGHNPVGSLMVFLMLTLILLQAISGLFMTDDIFTNGPYFESVSKSTQKVMAQIHSTTFDIIVIASVFHVGAILFYLIVKKENLIVAMFTGKKWVKDTFANAEISHSKLLIAFIVLAIVCIFVYWLVVWNVPIEEEFYY